MLDAVVIVSSFAFCVHPVCSRLARPPPPQVADQRPARLPVTFALMTLLLREHNRCCDEMAPEWNPANDEVRFA